ncbi:tyrosine-type recombinase/integrase [Actinocorallia libanotica]|uniref:Tyrosine recombinase XerC n=1 Tax=Actinocorallia libanotica TaxID=46162 RepID=A0ABN1R672_9ACTN
MAGQLDQTENMAQLFAAWINVKRAGKGLSDNTETAYRQGLAAWCKELAVFHDLDVPDDEDPMSVITPEHVYEDALIACAAAFQRQGYSERTRAGRLSALRGICKWLTKTRRLPFDPSVELEFPRIPARLPVALTNEELGRIVVAASTPYERARNQWISRDRALLAVYAGAGPRAAEGLSLTVRDVKREEGGALLLLHGKGNKDRNVPVDDLVVDSIDDYLAEREALLGPYEPGDPLFLTFDAWGIRQDKPPVARPMTTGMLEYLVDQWFLRAAVRRPEGELAHVFRHTFAVGVLRGGGSINELQALLGHEDMATTGIYTRVAAEDVMDLSKVSPVLAHLRDTRQPPEPEPEA